MATDNEFIDRFQQQIDLLKNLEQAIQGAIGRADRQMKEMKAGKSIEEVFGPVPPKQSSAAQGGGG